MGIELSAPGGLATVSAEHSSNADWSLELSASLAGVDVSELPIPLVCSAAPVNFNVGVNYQEDRSLLVVVPERLYQEGNENALASVYFREEYFEGYRFDTVHYNGERIYAPHSIRFYITWTLYQGSPPRNIIYPFSEAGDNAAAPTCSN